VREICILFKEIYKWTGEIHISSGDLYREKRTIGISSREIPIVLFLTIGRWLSSHKPTPLI